jgi:hypothetical protein
MKAALLRLARYVETGKMFADVRLLVRRKESLPQLV